jgi:uncharacterized protein (TIGR02265 family)
VAEFSRRAGAATLRAERACEDRSSSDETGDTAMIRVKGSVLRARLAMAEELGGAPALERILARLTSEEQAVLRTVLATGWYAFELGQRLDQAIVDELGRGRPTFFEKLGEASAEKNLSTVHKGFLVVGNPQAFLERAPTIYSFYYDQGRREYTKLGPNEAQLTTHDAETFSVADCATVIGWYRRALAMCGAVNPVVVEEECRARGGAVCRYRLRWS